MYFPLSFRLNWNGCHRHSNTLVNWSQVHGIKYRGHPTKGPYLPCVSMAGRALLAGYHRYVCNLIPHNRKYTVCNHGLGYRTKWIYIYIYISIICIIMWNTLISTKYWYILTSYVHNYLWYAYMKIPPQIDIFSHIIGLRYENRPYFIAFYLLLPEWTLHR